MKRTISIILGVTILLSIYIIIPITAKAETAGDFSYTVLENGTAEITDYSGSSSVLNIPATIDGYAVTSIGDEAFMGCNSFSSVNLPATVTRIGDNAFFDTEWYDNLPDGLIYLGKIAYQYKGECPSTVSIDEGTVSIGDSAFYYCTSLENVYLPESLKFIGNSAFEGCSSIVSVILPEALESIGNKAFMKCTGLRGIKIPETVTYLGSYAFSGCRLLRSANIPITLTEINPGVFNNCTFSEITIPNTVTSIGNDAFGGCNFLESITIPDSVTSIGNYAFSSCIQFTHITIPASVTSIGRYAFYYCRSLSSITIPDSVVSLGDCAFSCCESLKTVRVPDVIPEIGVSAFADTPWYYKQPDGVMYLGKMAYEFKGTYTEHIEIKEGTLVISHNAFSSKTILSVTIPSSVTTIYDDSFGNSKNLRTIYGFNNTAAEEYVNNKNVDGKIYIEFVSLGTAPETRLIGDTNFDGSITISDVTEIQRHLAELIHFTDEQLVLADTNGDDIVDINDATHLQKYLAEFDGIVLGKG